MPQKKPPQATRSLPALDALVGTWAMVGTHPAIPSPVKGTSTFEWLVEGGLLLWRSDWEPSEIPSAVSVIGRDDSGEAMTVLYTDERGVGRIYEMAFDDGTWKMWRDSPGFSQRMKGSFNESGNAITVRGELSRDGSNWGPDLTVSYTRK